MKAIVGSWEHRPYRLLAENAALRARIAELETALRESRDEAAMLRSAVLDDHVLTLVDSRVEVALSR